MNTHKNDKTAPTRYQPSDEELGVDTRKELRRIQIVVAIILVLLVLGFAALFMAMVIDQRTHQEPQPEGAPITTTNVAVLYPEM